MLMSLSELLQERLGKDVPKPAAFAWFLGALLVLGCRPREPCTCRLLQRTHANECARPGLSMWALEMTMRKANAHKICSSQCGRQLRVSTRRRLYVEGATHCFSIRQRPIVSVYDQHVQAGRWWDGQHDPKLKDAADARDAVVRFWWSGSLSRT